MYSGLTSWYRSFLAIDRYDRIKLLLLTLSFCCVIASYTLVKELKDTVFLSIVGQKYHPTAKVLSMIVLVPAILLYSYLVDRLRRYQLLYVYSIVYALLCFAGAFYLGDPAIGLANNAGSPWRLFGWFFYFAMEGYSPFVVSLVWAFANSITDPKFANQAYSLMVSGAKLGGIAAAAFAWYLFSRTEFPLFGFNEVEQHQLLLTISGLFLLLLPLTIRLIMKVIPGHYLHGYEAVYQLQKQSSSTQEVDMFAGLRLLFANPYVLGIYGMIFFYEVLNAVLNYQRLFMVSEASATVGAISAHLFEQQFYVHVISFLVSLLGTTALVRYIGQQGALVFIPVASGLAVLWLMLQSNLSALIATFIVVRGINYGVSYPVRESLYIPTVKDIKFKSKSWIDAFGSKFAKMVGGIFNMIAARVIEHSGEAVYLMLQNSFFAVLIGAWFATSYLLGRRYTKAISKDEVIGSVAGN